MHLFFRVAFALLYYEGVFPEWQCWLSLTIKKHYLSYDLIQHVVAMGMRRSLINTTRSQIKQGVLYKSTTWPSHEYTFVFSFSSLCTNEGLSFAKKKKSHGFALVGSEPRKFGVKLADRVFFFKITTVKRLRSWPFRRCEAYEAKFLEIKRVAWACYSHRASTTFGCQEW